ncbi:hypothetical protein [Lichenicoccus roseus]|nr:hypothetical protein [Lichenicoccus roseus]
MAKGQKRGNRETKKPKATKVAVAPPSTFIQSKAVRPLPSKSAGK